VSIPQTTLRRLSISRRCCARHGPNACDSSRRRGSLQRRCHDTAWTAIAAMYGRANWLKDRRRDRLNLQVHARRCRLHAEGHRHGGRRLRGSFCNFGRDERSAALAFTEGCKDPNGPLRSGSATNLGEQPVGLVENIFRCADPVRNVPGQADAQPEPLAVDAAPAYARGHQLAEQTPACDVLCPPWRVAGADGPSIRTGCL